MTQPNFDRIARPYRWLEYLSFGPMLERCRFCRIPELADARRALILGDGDGRFLSRLLTCCPLLEADVVDGSAVMLGLLQKRVSACGAENRVHLYEADARSFQPQGTYDLVVTHFFLDCFTEKEIEGITANLAGHLSSDAIWLISEFAVPDGLARYPAKWMVALLYTAFRWITGLPTRALPAYSRLFSNGGFALLDRRVFLAGLLVSELWQLQPTDRNL